MQTKRFKKLTISATALGDVLSVLHILSDFVNATENYIMISEEAGRGGGCPFLDQASEQLPCRTHPMSQLLMQDTPWKQCTISDTREGMSAGHTGTPRRAGRLDVDGLYQ